MHTTGNAALRAREHYRASVRTRPRRRRTASRRVPRPRTPRPGPECAQRADILAPMRRTAASVGRMLVTVGLLILLFVAYQLWGTGIFTERAQRDLRAKFHSELQDNPT